MGTSVKSVTLFKVRRDNNCYEGPCGIIGEMKSEIVATFFDEQQANKFVDEHDCKVYSYVVEKQGYHRGLPPLPPPSQKETKRQRII